MEPETPFRYLRYVTIGEVFENCKTAIVIWVVISVVTVAAYWVFDTAASAVVGASVDQHSESAIDSTLKAVSSQVWFFVCFGLFLWFARGKTLRMPMYGFWGWVFCNLVVVVMVTAISFSRWAFLPVYFGLMMIGNALDTLNDLGRENYEAMEEQRQESESIGVPDGWLQPVPPNHPAAADSGFPGPSPPNCSRAPGGPFSPRASHSNVP